MSPPLAIHWFRQDLRLSDSPSLRAAVAEGRVLPVYILDDENPGERGMGAASRVWLHHSLLSLSKSLGGALSLYKGDPLQIISDICERAGARKVFWNRCYEPWRMARDARVKEGLESRGVAAQSFNGSLLWEPWTVKKDDGTPYRVFTPFFRKGCMRAPDPREPLPAPSGMDLVSDPDSLGVDGLGLLPRSRWDRKVIASWTPGEDAALKRLGEFLESGIQNYREGRNLPSMPHVSRLSPRLRFGEISPNQAWSASLGVDCDDSADCFRSELGWREFSYSLLYFNHGMPSENLQPKFDAFPWSDDPDRLSAWQAGRTGVPMVDAGMRELWETGYMHNRVRMICASFLVKNLLVDWRHGERWFWDCLLDADLASNSASWQWVAGCGADAAPYFRVFNPVSQGLKFDPDGAYVRRHVPELENLPAKHLFSPWEAPEDVLSEAGVVLGKTYPRPIVDLKASREEALLAFKSL